MDYQQKYNALFKDYQRYTDEVDELTISLNESTKFYNDLIIKYKNKRDYIVDEMNKLVSDAKSQGESIKERPVKYYKRDKELDFEIRSLNTKEEYQKAYDELKYKLVEAENAIEWCDNEILNINKDRNKFIDRANKIFKTLIDLYEEAKKKDMAPKEKPKQKHYKRGENMQELEDFKTHSKVEFRNDKEYRTITFNPNNFLKIEKTSHVETRDDGTQENIEEEKMVLEGYPIVFNQETLIGDERNGWLETIIPESLDGTDMSDTPLKYNHQDITPILARVRNGSLKLTPDEHGLHMRAELLDTQSNKDFYKMVKAGLLDKMSFGFNVIEDDFDKLAKPATRVIRKIGRLFDVSIVDTPAYSGTSLEARSKEIAEARALAEAEAEARALKELENSNRLKDFEFRKKKQIALLKLGGSL